LESLKDHYIRTSVSEFKRKPLNEISDIEGADDLLEAARLPPSAGNQQLWFLQVINVDTHLFI